MWQQQACAKVSVVPERCRGWLPGGSWMFWTFVVICWGWVTLGAIIGWTRGLTPPAVLIAIVVGAGVLKFCRTVGLVMVAVAAEATVWMMGFGPSTLLGMEPDELLTLTVGDAGKMLEGVGPGGLTSVTVGTVCWDDVTLFWEAVRIIDVTETAAALGPLTGPLLTDAAGCALSPLVSTDAPPAMWQFSRTELPFRVWAPFGPLLPVVSNATDTTPPAVSVLGCAWTAVMFGSAAAAAVPAAPSMLEARKAALLVTPHRAYSAHESNGSV